MMLVLLLLLLMMMILSTLGIQHGMEKNEGGRMEPGRVCLHCLSADEVPVPPDLVPNGDR